MHQMIDIAARITLLEGSLAQLTKRSERKNAKLERDGEKGQFVEARGTFIDRVLKEFGHSEATADGVREELQAIRAKADPSWYPAIDYTTENLMPALRKQSRRSPQLRATIKALPYLFAALAVAAYFSIAVYSRTPVTADIETRQGLQQRAAAAEKAIRYDDYMSSRVRKGGWLKGIVLWPIEPNDAEVEAAAEFVALVLEGQAYAEACPSIPNDGEVLSDDQIKMVGNVAEYLQNPNVEWREPPIMTLVDGLQIAEACGGSS